MGTKCPILVSLKLCHEKMRMGGEYIGTKLLQRRVKRKSEEEKVVKREWRQRAIALMITMLWLVDEIENGDEIMCLTKSVKLKRKKSIEVGLVVVRNRKEN